MSHPFGAVAVLVVSVLTVGIGIWGLRFSRTTSDFFVASRTVRPALNASAIGGEYLSAASFLGVAGLVLAFGADMLWYPVGWTAGYLLLLALVAAPLRRSGAYTLPDFAQARLRSRPVRIITSALVVAIGWLYLIPQLKGAGFTLNLATGLDNRLGGLVVAVVVLVNVVTGGMRSVTFVQAFQYWLKLTALLVPAVFLLLVWFGDGATSPADAMFDLPGQSGWADPLSGLGPHPIYTTYSIVIATFLGTMGLPHVVVRFYTNPDGRAARRTTLVVLGLLGIFYVLPPVYGALGRIYAGDLVAEGRADTVVIQLPLRMIGGTGGELLAALLVAGAFAAFLSTSSGLTIAVAGVLSQDVMSRWLGGIASFRRGRGAGRVGRLRAGGAGRGRRRRHRRRSRLRRGRLDVLPPARARHLVATPHRRRRHRRAGGGRRDERRGRAAHVRRHRGRRLVLHPDGPARRLDRPARVRRDGRRFPAHPRPPATARHPLHGPPPHPRDRHRRPRVVRAPSG